MEKSEILLVGGGGHCRAVLDVLWRLKISIAGIVDVDPTLNEVLGVPIIGTDAELPKLREAYEKAFVTIGQIKTSHLRRNIYRLLVENGFILPVITSPYAYTSSHAKIDAGTIIMHHAVINAGAYVGSNCIVNTGAIVEHDVIVEDHCHISTTAALNGGVHVGEGTFIGSGALIKEYVSIGKNCVVGMGARVRHDVADDSRVWGDV
ncbi:MAG: acetyltransferase [Bacteroidales bacterium]|nr:acetyltransferase [Bacteroidales bacterium]